MGKTCGTSEVDVCLFLGCVCLYFLNLEGISLYLKILFSVDLLIGFGQSFFRLVQGVRRGQGGMGFLLVARFVLVGLCCVGLGFFRGLARRGLRLALRE